MRIIIPVAGSGSRLQPHTTTTPKPLMPLAGRPVLSHIIDLVKPLDPEEIVFVTGHLGDQIESWVAVNCPVKYRCVEQTTLHGLGYGVLLALETIESGPVMIFLGDTLVDTDLVSFTGAGDNVIGVKRVEDPRKFGVATIENGKVTDLVEKPETPPSDLAVVGLYFMRNPSALRQHLEAIYREDYRTFDEIQLTDGLSRLMREGVAFTPYEVDGWYDCGEEAEMLATNAYLLERLRPKIDLPGCRIVEPNWIDDSARVSGSTIGPSVSIQADCLIENSTLENCIVREGTKIVNSAVKDSIVPQHCVIRDNARELSGSGAVSRNEKK